MDSKMAFMRANPDLKVAFRMLQDMLSFLMWEKEHGSLVVQPETELFMKTDKLPDMPNLRQIDIGFQFGGKAFRELIVFETQEALDKFKEGNFEFGGSASAVIWDEGKGRAITFENGAGVAIMPKAGAMAGISVGGQEFDYRAVNK